ncbi:Fis family transcriptional regulator [Shewanella algicola]|uniref:Fis family transcriptional regulator n=1 Tax=Shewanella algicola TaxID=640633 RepID=UPI0024951DD1|nr:Fis family transcriptional regulator [Shewanella algicola]
MRKSDKKIDNQLRLALTDVCDHALECYPGFEWITHAVDYDSFPKSLRIVCVFDAEQQLRHFNHQGHKTALLAHIKRNLADVGIVLNNIDKQVSFDTETACQQQHNGNWALRLNAAIINHKFH